MTIRILDAAIARIDQSGEASVRLRDLAADVGISEPTLYHYFRNRESLIVAAHARRYRLNMTYTLDPFVEAMHNAQSMDEVVKIIQAVFSKSYDPGRDTARSNRIEVLGNAYRRPALAREVKKAMSESLIGAIDSLRLAQERGWLRSDYSPAAFALFNLGLISGLAFPEMFGDPEINKECQQMAFEAVTLLMQNKPD